MKFSIEKTVSNYIIPAIIALGVTIPLFVETAVLSTVDKDIENAFYSLFNGFSGYENFKIAWKPRLFSNQLAAMTAHVSDWILQKKSVPFIQNPIELTVALWTAGWFLLICALLILSAKRKSIFFNRPLA